MLEHYDILHIATLHRSIYINISMQCIVYKNFTLAIHQNVMVEQIEDIVCGSKHNIIKRIFLIADCID